MPEGSHILDDRRFADQRSARARRPHRFLRELAVRVAVAAVALPVVAALLWLGGLYTAALLATAGALAAREYFRLTPVRGSDVRWIGLAAATVLPALPLMSIVAWPAIALAIAGATSVATWTWLLLGGPRADAPARAGHVLAGVAFVATGLVALATLRARPDGLAWSTLVLVTAWANDTGAFLGGKLLGHHRLLPAVSPGKTREGLAIGGLVGVAGALVTAVGFAAITRDDAISVGIAAAIAGPIGDLCKSMLKRAAGAKDSGSLFLAHGGMLDRIDAVLFDAVAVVAYLALTGR